MKKVFANFHSKKSGESTSGSPGRHSPPESNPRARNAINNPLGHAIRATTSVALASVGTLAPSQLQDLLSPSSSPVLSPSHTPTTSPNSDQHNITGDTPTVKGPGWKTTAYSGVKLALDVVKESSDVFTPLKSVVGGLTALFRHYDQYISNKDDVQRLILRVESLISSLTGPPRENDFKEIERRKVLEANLKRVLETLDPMLSQSNISGFLNNADQSAQITGVVEDIRDAIIGYQTSLQQGLNENTMTIIESTHLALLDKLPRAKGARYESGDRQNA